MTQTDQDYEGNCQTCGRRVMWGDCAEGCHADIPARVRANEDHYDVPADVEPGGTYGARPVVHIQDDPRGDYTGLAAAFLQLADAVAAPRLADRKPAWVTVQIQPEPGDTEKVDAYACAVLGKIGAPRQMVSGGWHYDARGRIEGVEVSIFCAGGEPDWAKRERLAAELAELDAQIGGDRA